MSHISLSSLATCRSFCENRSHILFFCIFGDRDEDSIVRIKKERKILISCHLVTLGQVLGCRYAMMDPKDLL